MLALPALLSTRWLIIGFFAFLAKQFVADFLLQSQWMAFGKERAERWIAPLLAHASIHAALTARHLRASRAKPRLARRRRLLRPSLHRSRQGRHRPAIRPHLQEHLLLVGARIRPVPAPRHPRRVYRHARRRSERPGAELTGFAGSHDRDFPHSAKLIASNDFVQGTSALKSRRPRRAPISSLGWREGSSQ